MPMRSISLRTASSPEASFSLSFSFSDSPRTWVYSCISSNAVEDIARAAGDPHCSRPGMRQPGCGASSAPVLKHQASSAVLRPDSPWWYSGRLRGDNWTSRASARCRSIRLIRLREVKELAGILLPGLQLRQGWKYKMKRIVLLIRLSARMWRERRELTFLMRSRL